MKIASRAGGNPYAGFRLDIEKRRTEIVKSRPDQKVEDALDSALADTFPASDPIAVLQPVSAGRGLNLVPPEQRESAGLTPARKDSFPRAVGF
jgi:hypothetical protein